MTLAYMMDHHVPRAITEGLRQAGVDVLTAFEDTSHELSDPALMTRATELERVLFTFDDDLLVEAHHRQQNDIQFSGLVFTRFSSLVIGRCIEDLCLMEQTVEAHWPM